MLLVKLANNRGLLKTGGGKTTHNLGHLTSVQSETTLNAQLIHP